jgi:uncharacterized protein YcnI
MRKLITAAVAAVGVVVFATPALAHVTVQPNEAIVGSFSRFVVRVPNERDDASTTKVTLELPPLAFVSFEPKDGWKRTQETVEFDEPLEVFGEEVTEGVGEVTWSGGEVAPGEFQEFGFSARMPDGEETLTFNAIQTYSSGEVVEWTGAPDSETPAAQLNVFDIGAEEGEGQLAVLARVAADEGGETEAADDAEEDEGSDSLGLILGGVGIALGLIAIVMASRGRTT